MTWLEKLDLEPLLTADIRLKGGVDIGDGPFGRQTVVEIDTGTFEFVNTSDFSGVHGEIMPGASDHALFGVDDATVMVNVRGVMKTTVPADVHIAIRYQTCVPLSKATLQLLASGTYVHTFEKSKFITQPKFDVGQPTSVAKNHRFDFARLMRAPILAHAQLSHRRIEYRMYEVMNRTAG